MHFICAVKASEPPCALLEDDANARVHRVTADEPTFILAVIYTVYRQRIKHSSKFLEFKAITQYPVEMYKIEGWSIVSACVHERACVKVDRGTERRRYSIYDDLLRVWALGRGYSINCWSNIIQLKDVVGHVSCSSSSMLPNQNMHHFWQLTLKVTYNWHSN